MTDGTLTLRIEEHTDDDGRVGWLYTVVGPGDRTAFRAASDDPAWCEAECAAFMAAWEPRFAPEGN